MWLPTSLGGQSLGRELCLQGHLEKQWGALNANQVTKNSVCGNAVMCTGLLCCTCGLLSPFLVNPAAYTGVLSTTLHSCELWVQRLELKGEPIQGKPGVATHGFNLSTWNTEAGRSL